MKLRLAVFVPLFLAVPATAEQPAPVTVPFEMLETGKLISGHLTVKVKINGKGPYRLVFDTGAPVILLSTRVGKEAGLTGEKRAKQTKSDGKMSVLPGQVRVGKLDVGGVVADDLQAIVFDHPTVKAIAEVFGPIDGIVGFPFFARYRTAIDYQAKTLTFTPNGYQPGDVVQKLMATLLRPRRASDGPRVIGAEALWGMRVDKGEGDEEAGVTVSEVFANSAAAKAGLVTGDRLLTLDGRWTDTVNDCYHAAAATKSGQAVQCELRRNGKSVKLTVAPVIGF
jgi:hypothetical protein